MCKIDVWKYHVDCAITNYKWNLQTQKPQRRASFCWSWNKIWFCQTKSRLFLSYTNLLDYCCHILVKRIWALFEVKKLFSQSNAMYQADANEWLNHHVKSLSANNPNPFSTFIKKGLQHYVYWITLYSIKFTVNTHV